MPDLLRESLLNFENHKSLKTLKLGAELLASDPKSKEAGFLNTLISLIESPLLEVVIVYERNHFHALCSQRSQGHVGYDVGSASECRYYCRDCYICWKQFKVLSKARKVRNFRLVFYVASQSEDTERPEITRLVLRLWLHVEAYRRGELHSLLFDSSIISAIPCRSFF